MSNDNINRLPKPEGFSTPWYPDAPIPMPPPREKHFLLNPDGTVTEIMVGAPASVQPYQRAIDPFPFLDFGHADMRFRDMPGVRVLNQAEVEKLVASAFKEAMPQAAMQFHPYGRGDVFPQGFTTVEDAIDALIEEEAEENGASTGVLTKREEMALAFMLQYEAEDDGNPFNAACAADSADRLLLALAS
jgi:hypothetical protein